MASRLDASLQAFAERRLEEPFSCLLLDARCEKVHEEGSVRFRAAPIALGMDAEGWRHALAVELSDKESGSSWTEFLSVLKARACGEWNIWSRTVMKG